MKKGDKVRFLSEVGGGKVAGFQGKNIVLVEDEDGFEIPMPINEVVVVEQDEYSMGKMISAKMDAQQKAEEHANTELHQDSRSIKAIWMAICSISFRASRPNSSMKSLVFGSISPSAFRVHAFPSATR